MSGKEIRDQASGDFMSRLFSEVSGVGRTQEVRPPSGAVYTRRGFYKAAQQQDLLGLGFGGSSAAAAAGVTSGTSGGGRSNAQISTPIYYDPRYSTPDKFYYPRSEVQANAIWRHMYRSDPAVGAALEVWSELPFSEFDLLGLEDDPRVKEIYESMLSDLNLLSWMPEIAREYLITGKVIPHLIYDARKNYWSNIIVYNPDYVNVTPVPVPGYEPVLDLKPTPELKALASSQDPRLMHARSKLPPRVLHYAVANIPIPLDPLNASYIARRSAPYTHVGTSLLSRLFRLQMLEDFLTNSTIAVAQRNAAPLRIFKLGDPSTGYLPTKADEESFLSMLAIAETDPFAAIVYNYALQVELVGVSDRMMCHPKGALVTLADGTRCAIENLKPGEKLQGGSGKPVDVVKVTPLQHSGQIVEVSIQGLPEKIRMTPEHRLLAIQRPSCYQNGKPCRKWRKQFGREHTRYCNTQFSKLRSSGKLQPQEIHASDFKKGDILVAPRCLTGKKIRPVTPEIARLIGLYLADGSITKVPPHDRQGVKFALDRSDTDIISDIKSTLSGLGVRAPVYEVGVPGSNGVEVKANHPQPAAQKIADLMMKYAGRYSSKKQLHKEVFLWEEDLQLELLRGYFLGDGWVHTETRAHGKKLGDNIQVLASTTSPRLADQLVRLLQITGFVPSLDIREEKYHRDLGHKGAPRRHTITLTCESAKRMYEILRRKPYAGEQRKKGGNRVVENWIQYLVKDVKRIPYAGTVYNLEVTGDNLYLVGFISSHNSVTREWDYIERVKFLALGISKSFLLGETSFAAAVAGLQTLVERLQTFRRMFERRWITPKIFVAIAKMNEFYRRTPAELSHRVRIQKKESQLIIPKLWWRKRLEPTQDTSLLSIWNNLLERGLISERTMATGAGVDLDSERRQLVEEREYKKQVALDHPDLFEEAPAEGAGGGLPGSPPMMASSKKKPRGRKAGNGNGHDPYRFSVPSDFLVARIWDKEGVFRGVHYQDVEPIAELLSTGDTSHPTWQPLGRNTRDESGPVGWDEIDHVLVEQGTTDEHIKTIRHVLVAEHLLPDENEMANDLTEAESLLDKALTHTGELGVNDKDLLGGRHD